MRLQRRGLFTWQGTGRHGGFLHRKQRFAGPAIEHVKVALLGRADKGGNSGPTYGQVDQRGLGGNVLFHRS